MANELTTQKQQTGIATYLGSDAVRKNISNVIGPANTTRFISSVVSAVQANPQLAKCTNASILSAALQGEALQLAPSPQLGMFYMTPYKNKKRVGNQWVEVEEAQFSLGYKGMIQLAIRSGQYKTIVVSEIKEGEVEYNPITEEMVTHPIMDPAEREAAKTIGYYASFELLTGFEKHLYSSKESIEAHALHYSRSYRYDRENNKKSSPWTTNFDAMAKKTMLRRLLKWGPSSVEMQQAYTNDMAVIEEDGTARYVDNPQTVDVEVRVQEDIQANANSVQFEEAAAETPVKEEPKPAEAPKQKAAATKKSVSKKEPEKLVEQEVETVIDIEDEDEAPDWA